LTAHPHPIDDTLTPPATRNDPSNIEAVVDSANQPSSEHPPAFHSFPYDVTGLKGKRLRVLTDMPTDGMAPVELPIGVTDVIAVDDEVSVFLTLQVHPVDDPSTVASVLFDQLALFDDQP
jgi:hypothetical protein